VRQAMESENYIADDPIATTVFLALRMKKPILIEGEPGSGKTEVAKVLARMLDTELIRLQCYEGLDVNMALYEWDYPRQMLRIRMEEASESSKEEIESAIFSERYLLERPLLKAITHEGDGCTGEAGAPDLFLNAGSPITGPHEEARHSRDPRLGGRAPILERGRTEPPDHSKDSGKYHQAQGGFQEGERADTGHNPDRDQEEEGCAESWPLSQRESLTGREEESCSLALSCASARWSVGAEFPFLPAACWVRFTRLSSLTYTL